MKVHYINILLFALPLNILEHNQRNDKKNIFRITKTKPIKPHRSLCECELYAPSNYENDPEMKKLMENFNHQMSERFRAYDERVQDKRKQCKEQYEKDIQKIILKDKIEKQLAQQFFTLQANMDSNDIPTCVCEKSVADKTEKVCLNCGRTMGAVTPAWGLVSGVGYVAWTHYVAAKVVEAGVKAAISRLDSFPGLTKLPGTPLTQIITSGNFSSESLILEAIQSKAVPLCSVQRTRSLLFCHFTKNGENLTTLISNSVKEAAESGINAAAAEGTKLSTNTTILTNTIIASIVAIVVIVLVMVIIYLILRYRRKKKMNKKLQYIKLLK
ncbi:PIR protein, putative [Plasmodium sp.]|nr:PIR protein, putative [Plasmodium sp.]